MKDVSGARWPTRRWPTSRRSACWAGCWRTGWRAKEHQLCTPPRSSGESGSDRALRSKWRRQILVGGRAHGQGVSPGSTDDILPIDVRNGVPHGRAGYPNMRMWPADAERYTGSTRELRVIHPDFDKPSIPLGERRSFCDQATELAAIYLLDSSDNTETLKFQRIPPVEAVVALASVSFAAPVAGAAARRRERFAVLTAVANEIPVWWLSYGRRGSSRCRDCRRHHRALGATSGAGPRREMYTVDSFGRMIADPARSTAYAEALRRCVRPGDVVVDLGAGTGAFSLLACRLGAGRVRT